MSGQLEASPLFDELFALTAEVDPEAARAVLDCFDHPADACRRPQFDPAEYVGPADHAAACSECPLHGTGVGQ